MSPTALRGRKRESTHDDEGSKESRKGMASRDALRAVLSKKESKHHHRERSRGASKRESNKSKDEESNKSKHGRDQEHVASFDHDPTSAASPRDRWRTSTASLPPSFLPLPGSRSLCAHARSRRNSRERKTESRSGRERRKSRGRREEEEEEAEKRGSISSRLGQGASGLLSETRFSGMWIRIECSRGMCMHEGRMGLSNAQSICNASSECYSVLLLPLSRSVFDAECFNAGMLGALMLPELQEQVLQCWQQHLQWQQVVDLRLNALQSCVSEGALVKMALIRHMQHIRDKSDWYQTHIMPRSHGKRTK